ncbi:MAG: hypothetical protein LRY36_01355 [Alphaproteobacteria bacterium]|nr:hypothetical protein [Alphaproteobacteria bacterium]MCD8566564.1 hypothetical protein [Alphaproteobacteria bacterium]
MQGAVWFYARDFQARWTNVPPVPSVTGVSSFALGDKQFAYRSVGIMIQNLGDTGGRTTNIDDYNYDDLAGWFYLTDKLDPRSNFIPFLAAYYFGSVQKPENAKRLVDYLAYKGVQPGDQQWRWLARAAFLARFAEKNLERALTLSQQLAGLYPRVPLPFWARQMPVFILEEHGEKEAALAMILETLKSESSTLPPQEINTMVDYVCTRLLTKEEVSIYPLCQDFKELRL